MLVIVVCYGIGTITGAIFTCTPVSFFWNKTQNGQCINQLAFWFSNAGINIASDIILWAIPLPVLKSLRLPRKQKYGLIIVFGVGIL